MFALLHKKPHWYHYLFLCTLAFLVRALTLHYFVAPEGRFQQPDSNDYHYAAMSMGYGHGMFYPDGRPIFWRTPGYPWFLSKFYDTSGPGYLDFAQHKQEHMTALWMQVALCSIIPLLIFQLAWILTHTLLIAWLASLISIVHLGFVLASTYLLTDGLALIFFIAFLALFFASFHFSHETTFDHQVPAIRRPYLLLACAALALGIYTWMRPMGQFIALVGTMMVLCSSGAWSPRLKKAAFFLCIFFASVFPWFWRNHQLTGKWFFCPLFGLYFNAFNAPKILARVDNIPLEAAHKQLSIAAHQHIVGEYQRRRAAGDTKFVCHEAECMQTAWPFIKNHPGYFIYDWIVEVAKTTFDLYASQLVAIAGDCYRWDPLVEYLDEKIKKCLYEQPMSWPMRACAWVEFIASIFMWLGIFAGLWMFVIRALYTHAWQRFYSYGLLWIKTGIFIGVVVMQTGGFGYARLRLPVEPLLLILGLTFWWWLYNTRSQKLI